jgi:uncharacterized protein
MLANQITEDLKKSMKERNELKTSVLRMVKSALKNKAIELKKDTLEDTDAIKVLQKEVKQRRDSVAEYEKANRKDLADKEASEINILETYLPKQLSDNELKDIVKKALDAAGITSKADMGRAMKEVMPAVKGQADGKRVSQAVASLLS